MTSDQQPTDAQLLARLRRSSKPKTAAELGTTSVRLRGLEGVREAGRQKTGRPGRPAVLFTADPVETSSDAESRQGGFPVDAQARAEA